MTESSLLFRCNCTIWGMFPKLAFNYIGMCWYRRHLEKKADRFACEHAESRQELEAFKEFFDELEEENFQAMLTRPVFANANEKKRDILMMLTQFKVDPEHPRPAARSAVVQKYIDKWDAEHKK